jgi:hypothetical protein
MNIISRSIFTRSKQAKKCNSVQIRTNTKKTINLSKFPKNQLKQSFTKSLLGIHNREAKFENSKNFLNKLSLSNLTENDA